jgi:hypothetical protein
MNIQADLSEFEKCFFAGSDFDKGFEILLKKKKINFSYYKTKKLTI